MGHVVVTVGCRGVRGIFFQRGQRHFSWFFPAVKCFFPVENSHFDRPKTNFSGFEKWKAKKKKKKKGSSTHFVTSPFFKISTSPFSIFLLFCSIFPFFLASLFPVGQKFHSTPPPTFYATGGMGHVLVTASIINCLSGTLIRSSRLGGRGIDSVKGLLKKEVKS